MRNGDVTDENEPLCIVSAFGDLLYCNCRQEVMIMTEHGGGRVGGNIKKRGRISRVWLLWDGRRVVKEVEEGGGGAYYGMSVCCLMGEG